MKRVGSTLLAEEVPFDKVFIETIVLPDLVKEIGFGHDHVSIEPNTTVFGRFVPEKEIKRLWKTERLYDKDKRKLRWKKSGKKE